MKRLTEHSLDARKVEYEEREKLIEGRRGGRGGP